MTNMKENIRIQLLLTGNELMSGVTTDSNSAMIAETLAAINMSIYRKVTVGDDMELLVYEIQQLSKNSDVLIINGGLGPTIDDLTASALAKASALPLEQHPQALDHVQSWCQRVNAQLSAANLKQALLPKGVGILENPIGSAVGFSLTLNNCLILCTPGVPSELEAMLDAAIIPLLKKTFPNSKTAIIERIHCFGIGEAALQQKVDDEIKNWPKIVELSFRAGAPTLEIKLTIFSQEHVAAQQQCKQWLYDLFGNFIVAEGKDTLASTLLTLLKKQNKKVTFAESCTGGKMASLLTEIPGASDVFEAGFVTYSNKIKSKIINVSKETLDKYGAVSEPVAQQMLLGALKKSGADYGVAVSGIAGPDGGSKEKPVGTVCIAWGTLTKNQSATLLIARPRKMFQLMVSATGFDLLRRHILELNDEAPYFKRLQVKK